MAEGYLQFLILKTKDANITQFSGEGSLGPVTSNLVLEVPVVKERSGILVGGQEHILQLDPEVTG
jgi:hypothetical protein